MVRFSPKKRKKKTICLSKKTEDHYQQGVPKSSFGEKWKWVESRNTQSTTWLLKYVTTFQIFRIQCFYLTVSTSTLLYLVQGLEIVTGKVWISHFQKCVSDIKVKFCPTKHVLGKFIFQIWNNVRDLLVKVKKDKYCRHPIFKFS